MKKVLAVVAAIVIVCALAAGVFLLRGKSGADRMEAAKTKMYAGNFTEAAADFDAIYEPDAVNYARYCRAAQYVADEQWASAELILHELPGFLDADQLLTYCRARDLEESQNYEWADSMLSGLTGYRDAEARRASYPDLILARDYAAAETMLQNGRLEDAYAAFIALGSYNDSPARAEEAAEAIRARDYAAAEQLLAAGDQAGARDAFLALGTYRDSASRAAAITVDMTEQDNASAYALGVTLIGEGRLDEALAVFTALGDYSDSADRAAALIADIAANDTAAAYAAADQLAAAGHDLEAYNAFLALGDYNDSADRALACLTALADKDPAAAATKDPAVVDAVAQQYADAGEYEKASAIWLAVPGRDDFRQKNYDMAVSLRDSDPLLACRLLGADAEYADARSVIYAIACGAEEQGDFETAIQAFAMVTPYEDSGLRCVRLTYLLGEQMLIAENYTEAARIFGAMGSFSDAPERVKEANYAAASRLMETGDYATALALLRPMSGYRDTDDLMLQCRYAIADADDAAGRYAGAAERFADLGDYRDSAERAKVCLYALAGEKQAAGRWNEAIELYSALGNYNDSALMLQHCYAGKADDAAASGELQTAYDLYLLASAVDGTADKAGDVACRLGMRALTDNQIEAAFTWYLKAEGRGDATDRVLQITDYYIDTHQYALAEDACNRMNSEAGRQRLYALAEISAAAGDGDEALRRYQAAGDYSDAADKAAGILYDRAGRAMAAGDYVTARDLYAGILDYRDASTLAVEAANSEVYRQAMEAYENKDYRRAKELFDSIPDFRDSRAMSDGISSKMIKVGDYVTFGHYPQTAEGTDNTPIEWLVLDKQDNRVLLISRYGLDAHRFDASEYQGWDKSEIRGWLNTDFLNAAFTAEEQRGIVTTHVSTPVYNGYVGGPDTDDKVWLLSRDEVGNYFESRMARQTIPTSYTVAQGAYQSNSNKLNGTGCCWWWLRSPGDYSLYASRVSSDGSSLSCSTVGSTGGSVRPAFWLDLNSADIH